MGHDKLRKFAENKTFDCLIQPSAEEVLADGYEHLRDHPVKGHWMDSLVSVSNNRSESAKSETGGPDCPSRFKIPICEAEKRNGNRQLVLELGCGKGEYTLELARRNPDKLYVGVDIKGARLWRGAKTATQEGLPNVKFLRTRVEFITAFFAPGEVSEIWLTFSDPQPKSGNNRLSSPVFLERYRQFLKPGGIVHLKTDSRFLHDYTLAVAEANGLEILADTVDLYSGTDNPVSKNSLESTKSETGGANRSSRFKKAPSEAEKRNGHDAIPPEVREVHTFYENMFLEQGVPITYLAFRLDHEGPFVQPERKFDSDLWRELDSARLSFGHQKPPKQ